MYFSIKKLSDSRGLQSWGRKYLAQIKHELLWLTLLPFSPRWRKDASPIKQLISVVLGWISCTSLCLKIVCFSWCNYKARKIYRRFSYLVQALARSCKLLVRKRLYLFLMLSKRLYWFQFPCRNKYILWNHQINYESNSSKTHSHIYFFSSHYFVIQIFLN